MTAVQLFLTCLGEQFFPQMLEQTVQLLERLGVQVSIPQEQICCGQPLFNSGFQEQARQVARSWLQAFGRSAAPIVAPSGSCVDMVRRHYPKLFPTGSPEHELATELAGRTFELTEFLVHQLKVLDVGASFPHTVTYHASCHYLRGLAMGQDPAKASARQLLEQVRGLRLIPLEEEETCCGFGGVFSVIYPEISQALMQRKIAHILQSGAEVVVACDAGCLMNIRGGLKRAGSTVQARHIVEILAAQEEGV